MIIMFLESFLRLVKKYYFGLALVAGSLSVSMWTLLRFLTKQSTFDLVGQQVLLSQWVKGYHANSMIGPTNYVIKMLVLYWPAQFLPGSPRLKLVILTILVNVITFVLSFIIIKKIYSYFGHKNNGPILLAIVWLSVVAGSVYWIQFTNSRNLEFVGGLYLIYLLLLSRDRFDLRSFFVLTLVASILLFADPLQLYMSATPTLAYISFYKLKNQFNRKNLIVLSQIYISLGLGYLVSKILFQLTSRILGINFIKLTSHTNGYSLFGTFVHGLVPAIKQSGRLYVGGHEYGGKLELLNLLLVFLIFLMAIYYLVKNKITRDFVWFVSIFLMTDFLFYIVSGQSLQLQTSRYLIMTVFVVILLIGSLLDIKSRKQILLKGLVIFVLVLDFSVLFYLTSKAVLKPDNVDAHIYLSISFMEKGGYSFGYSSLDTSLPADYYSNEKINLLPIACDNNSLVRSNLFFDMSFYKNIASKVDKLTPIILDGDSIHNFPSKCDQDLFIKYLGQPIKILKLSDNSTVLMYSSSVIFKGF